MTENVINILISSKNRATKSQKILIDFLLTANLNDIIYLSITEMSDLTGVGEATILRFCRQLGFKGYQDFKLTVAQELSPVTEVGKSNSYVKNIADNMIESLKGFREATNASVVESIIDVILASARVCVFGVGNSYIPALELHNRLMKLGILTYLEQGSHFANILTSSLGKTDCVIIFSVSGCTNDVIDVAEIAKKNGARVIVVTSHDKSPLVKYADVVLKCMRKESPVEAGSMLTKIGQLFIVDVITTGITLRNLDDYNAKIKKANTSVVKKLV